MRDKGLIILNTGNGKGKTTAAIGQAVRAAGHGYKVCIIQFIKGNWQTGEAKALALHPDEIEFHTKGTGFTWEAQKDEVVRAGRKAWSFAKKKIMSGLYHTVILDELTYLINFNIIPEKEILDLLANKPPALHIVMTGRDASPGLIAIADLVTEMREIKHPYSNGISARKGVEF